MYFCIINNLIKKFKCLFSLEISSFISVVLYLHFKGVHLLNYLLTIQLLNTQ